VHHRPLQSLFRTNEGRGLARQWHATLHLSSPQGEEIVTLDKVRRIEPTPFLDALLRERRRQQSQKKAEDNSHVFWHLVVADQLALVTRQLSLMRYHGVATSAGDFNVRNEDRISLQIGLVRLAACAMAWYEALDREAENL
jgi:hypothetical protein